MPASPTIQLAAELVKRASITPDDAGCQALIAERLSAIGFSCTWLNKNGVTNLWAVRGSDKPLLCFAGHTDVVSPGERALWASDPFVPTIRDGKLYGRGIADMKGGVAAFVVALERFVRGHPDHSGSLAVLLTSDEEGDAIDGTVHVVETLKARGEAIDFCIIGEPSSHDVLGDTLKNGRRGSLNGELIIHGVQGHIAYPQSAENPIHVLAPLLNELLAVDWDNGKTNINFPPTSFQCSNVHAGEGATNVIPGALMLRFNFRFSTEVSADLLKRRVADLLAKHDIKHTLNWQLSGEPFLTHPGMLTEQAVAAVKEVTGITPRLSCEGGTSDGRFIARICPQLIELGVSNATIHQVNECVFVDELNKLTLIYEKMIEGLLYMSHNDC
jgi:succinyl-diaminopimelate desuccinylase, proteobacterial clade